MAATKLKPQSIDTSIASTLGAWTSYTPTWSGGISAIGNAVVNARWAQIGKTVFCRIKVTMGSTTTFATGTITWTLPVNAAEVQYCLGTCYAEDSGTSGYQPFVFMTDVGHVYMVVDGTTGTYLTTTAQVSNVVPFTWTTGDYFFATFTYEAA